MLLWLRPALALCVAPFLLVEVDGGPACLDTWGVSDSIAGEGALAFENRCGEPLTLSAVALCDGCTFTIELEDGGSVEQPIVEYQRIEHEFGVSVQGATVDDALAVHLLGPTTEPCKDTGGCACSQGGSISWWGWMRR